MSEFKLRTTSGEIIYPDDMNAEEKKSLRTRCEANNIQLFCACNNVSEYKIKINGAVYPAVQNGQEEHEKSCKKSSSYQQNQKYNKGFEINDEAEIITAHLSESIVTRDASKNAPKVIVVPSNGINNRKYPDEVQGEITISAMIKNINMYTFKHVAFHERFEKEDYKYPNTEAIITRTYYTLNRTYIGKKRHSLATMNIKDDRCEFVYKKYVGFQQAVGKQMPRLLTITNDGKRRYTIPVYPEAYEKAIKEFENTYGSKDLGNKNIIFAGFRNKYGVHKLTFILVNDYGLHAESQHEVQMYDAICAMMNRYEFRRQGVHFYKPYEYGYGAYKDKYLEDGIFEFDHTNRKIIIEVYGMGTDDYLKRRAAKEEILAESPELYSYIGWDAYNNEQLPIKKIEEEIRRILESKE